MIVVALGIFPDPLMRASHAASHTRTKTEALGATAGLSSSVEPPLLDKPAVAPSKPHQFSLAQAFTPGMGETLFVFSFRPFRGVGRGGMAPEGAKENFAASRFPGVNAWARENVGGPDSFAIGVPKAQEARR